MRQGAWLVWNKTPLHRARWEPRPLHQLNGRSLLRCLARGLSCLLSVQPTRWKLELTNEHCTYVTFAPAELRLKRKKLLFHLKRIISRKATQRRTYNLECKRASCQSFLHISYAAVHGILKCIHLYSQSHWITAYLLQVRFLGKMRLAIRIKIRFYCATLWFHFAITRGEINAAVIVFLPTHQLRQENAIAEPFACECLLFCSRW